MTDLAFLSAVEQAELVRTGEVSSTELVDVYLARIEEHNEDLNAYVHLFAEDARSLAREKDEATAAADEPTALPSFHGVPVSIKETSMLEGRPMTFASRSMSDFVAPVDEVAVARLKQAGMVPLGKTNTPELGATPWTQPELFGPTRNPWNRARTPGGSTGGGAAAVAAGLCAVSQGSDGGGSLRIPASANGLFTIKATRDRISNGPLLGDAAFGFTTKGVLTRSVMDAAALLDVMAGYVPGDPGMLPSPERAYADEVGRDPGTLRVGVITADPLGALDGPVQDAVTDARSLLEDLGHATFDVTPDVDESVIVAFEQVWAAMAASLPFPLDDLEPLTAWLVEKGHAVTGGDYLLAQFRIQTFTRQFVARFHREFDVLLAPVLLQLPLEIAAIEDLGPGPDDAWDVVRRFVGSVTPLVNASGQPSVALPLAVHEDTSLPCGVQVIGRFAAEAQLVRLAAQIEAARPWADRRPPGL